MRPGSLLTLLLATPPLTVASCATSRPPAEPVQVVVVNESQPRPMPFSGVSSASLSELRQGPEGGAELEDYQSSIHGGNQVSLGLERAPFAHYLVAMHNRIHPVFATAFLDKLDTLPSTHPANNQGIFTVIEIVIEGDYGRVVRVGVVRSSGVTLFDVGVVDALQRAAPFGKASAEIRSYDGNVYIQWEFHRQADLACSTANSRPFLLSGPRR